MQNWLPGRLPSLCRFLPEWQSLLSRQRQESHPGQPLRSRPHSGRRWSLQEQAAAEMPCP
jgi:hypothetical protein